MASRLFLTAVPTLLFAFALGAGASCGNTTNEYAALDSGVGAGTTSGTTQTTSTTHTTTSTGMGGTGTTTTTTTNTCGGLQKCVTAADCLALGTTCLTNVCNAGCCGLNKAVAGTACSDNGGKLCNGSGVCVACQTASDCPASTSDCATAACNAGACGTTSLAKGTACTQGGTNCDGMGHCVAGSCTDGVVDGTETDVDCGGATCGPCADGKHCKVGSDCTDKVCSGTPLTCQAPTCSDGVQNGNETDVDCGGGSYMGAAPCPRCTNNQKCAAGSDCSSLNCVTGKCAAASCSDGIQDGTETDVDCGGASCAPCADGKKCAGNASNCQSHICAANGTCQVPSCTDNIKNGNETDIDCGGGSYMGAPACSPCHPGQKCSLPTDCIGNTCQTTCQCPQGMLVVPIQGGGIYCIDAVEVTNSAYNTFLSANPPTATQDAWCSWNVGWTPSAGYPYPMGNDAYPVNNVNWCQAAGYCKYQGRRLCGKIGVNGGPVPQASFKDYTQDQWFNACTANGVNCSGGGCYPYGASYNLTACNGKDSVDGGSKGPLGYNLLFSCQGGSVGLFNMSGNVAEWEDSCTASVGMSDQCAVRGGSYLSDQNALRCDSNQASLPITQTRGYSADDVGFRCCL